MTFTKRIFALLSTVICITLMTYCTKTEVISLSPDGNINDLFATFDIDSKIQRATIDVANFEFTSEMKVELNADPDAFVFQDGAPVSGMVELEFIELFTKAEILKYGIQTVTYDRQILESDGEFKIDITQNGKKVELQQGKFMNIVVPDTSLNDAMELFEDSESTWEPTGDTLVVLNALNAYIGQLSHLDWVNIDRYSKFDFDDTTVGVELPDTTYNWFNTRVFAIFHDQNIVINLQYFNNPILLPIGEKISVVAIVSQDPDTFLYDEQSVIIEENQASIILSPQPATADEISEAIDRLGN